MSPRFVRQILLFCMFALRLTTIQRVVPTESNIFDAFFSFELNLSSPMLVSDFLGIIAFWYLMTLPFSYDFHFSFNFKIFILPQFSEESACLYKKNPFVSGGP